jgi:exoribonuclease R
MLVAEMGTLVTCRALLRCHPPPNAHKMAELSTVAKELGFELDTSGAGECHSSAYPSTMVHGTETCWWLKSVSGITCTLHLVR